MNVRRPGRSRAPIRAKLAAMADDDEPRFTRKQFVQAAIAAVVVGACADEGSSDGGDSGGGSCDGDAAGMISANHGHALTVPHADIVAGAAVQYDIQGTATHDHPLTVSAIDMAKLADGETVSVTSGSGGADGHNHQVTLSC